MCGLRFGLYDRLKFAKQLTYGQGEHQVRYVREFSEHTVRAVCSCGWSATAYLDEHGGDPLDALDNVVDGHLKEEEEKKKAFNRKVDIDPLPYKSGLREEWLP